MREGLRCLVYVGAERLFVRAQGNEIRGMELLVHPGFFCCDELGILRCPRRKEGCLDAFGERMVKAVQHGVFCAGECRVIRIAALLVLDAERTDVRPEREAVERVVDGIVGLRREQHAFAVLYALENAFRDDRRLSRARRPLDQAEIRCVQHFLHGRTLVVILGDGLVLPRCDLRMLFREARVFCIE